jgi:hypothetical protein
VQFEMDKWCAIFTYFDLVANLMVISGTEVAPTQFERSKNLNLLLLLCIFKVAMSFFYQGLC